MSRKPMPAATRETPPEAREYMAAIQPFVDQGHPFAKAYFRQVSWFSVPVANFCTFDFFALEFRDGRYAALAWQDGPDRWGVGKWVVLARPDSDLTCAPSPIHLGYFKSEHPRCSLEDALDRLQTTKPVRPAPMPGAGLWNWLPRLFGLSRRF